MSTKIVNFSRLANSNKLIVANIDSILKVYLTDEVLCSLMTIWSDKEQLTLVIKQRL